MAYTENKALSKSYTFDTEPDPLYADNGGVQATNGLTLEQTWSGWEASIGFRYTDFACFIDLDSPFNIGKLKIYMAFADGTGGIYRPDFMTVYYLNGIGDWVSVGDFNAVGYPAENVWFEGEFTPVSAQNWAVAVYRLDAGNEWLMLGEVELWEWEDDNPFESTYKHLVTPTTSILYGGL